MKTRILLLAAAAAMAFTAISCSKDDGGDSTDPGNKVPDPEGTVELNMRNEDNGKTYLSPIYIDAGNNFTTTYNEFFFIDLGEMKGLGNITQFTTTGSSGSCAVIPGHGYLFYNYQKYKFPSGKTAYDVRYVYRVYVDSYILGVGNTILGAKIKYQNPFNPYGLPQTWEEYQATDAAAKGWEIKEDMYSTYSFYYIRSGEMCIIFQHKY